jgi:hypothetical protein
MTRGSLLKALAWHPTLPSLSCGCWPAKSLFQLGGQYRKPDRNSQEQSRAFIEACLLYRAYHEKR